MTDITVTDERLYKLTDQLVTQAGFSGDINLCPIKGGANNRVYKVGCDAVNLLLKVYFQHSSDTRDRLGAEFIFCRYAWEKGIRIVPQPLACDTENGLALYEWVDGRSLGLGEVLAGHVRQALDFFIDLNYDRHDAAGLPVASEACFSFSEHLQIVERRIERLMSMEAESDIDREAHTFISGVLRKMWQKTRDSVLEQTVRLGYDVDAPVDRSDRCVSPSDFGFHNAIVTADGRLCFVDFEYAGWDDPAKLVCDFFCQPAVPVPFDFYEEFSEGVARITEHAGYHLKRFETLLPVYQIKWTCIMLNEFLLAGNVRRQFARGKQGDNRKRRQLEKAAAFLKRSLRI